MKQIFSTFFPAVALVILSSSNSFSQDVPIGDASNQVITSMQLSPDARPSTSAMGPVGTVVALALPTYVVTAYSNAGWIEGEWILAAGQTIDDSSLYAKLVRFDMANGYNSYGPKMVGTQIRVPDIQGSFLRGIDTNCTGSAGRCPNGEVRPVGSGQEHALMAHKHYLGQATNADGSGSGTRQFPNLSQPADNPIDSFHGGRLVDNRSTNPADGDRWISAEETRPENVAVHYYIRIN